MSGLWLNVVSFINTYAAPVGNHQCGVEVLYPVSRRGYVGDLVYLSLLCRDEGMEFSVERACNWVVTNCVAGTEEIDEIFADPHPVKASLRKQKVIVPLDQ
jgi:hypothetical protein